VARFVRHFYRFSGGGLDRPRFVFKGGEGDEYVEVGKEKKQIGQMDKSELRTEYETARDEVREKLKQYDDKKAEYKIFLDYANQRLNQVDVDLKKFDVLEPKQIRDNLKRLHSILEFAADVELKERKKDLIGAIEKQKRTYIKKLEDRYKEHESMLAAEVKPETLKFARTKMGETKAKMAFLFNERIRAVDSSITKQFNTKWEGAESRSETIMLYLKSVEEGISSTEKGSTGESANELFREYEDAVRGQFCIEEAKQEIARPKVKTICLDYMLKYRQSRPDVHKAFSDIMDKYLLMMDSVKGEEAYKVQAIIYGQFLDEVRGVRRTMLDGEKDVPVRNFGLAAADQVDEGRKAGEKSWDKVSFAKTQLVDYKPDTDYFMKKGQPVHYLATEGLPDSANGLVIDFASQGTRVQVLDQAPVKVKTISYLHVQVKDDKGKVTAEGWVRADSLAPEAKPEKKTKGSVA